ncbi:MAG: multimeric flavodoxin WrbA [Arenicella sp.]|jgi:multimeric flavodoxin WrbA
MTQISKSLLIIAHTPSPNSKAMAEAILDGATDSSVDGVTVRLASPFDCSSEMVLESDALVLFTTENFGYMSGALKDFFERIYYPCLDDTKRNDAKPFALVIKAGLDGTGTDISVGKITSGLKWRPVQATTLCKGEFEPEFIARCRDIGLTIAASLEAEII